MLTQALTDYFTTLLQQVVLSKGDILTPMAAVITQRDSRDLFIVSDAGMLSFAHFRIEEIQEVYLQHQTYNLGQIVLENA